MCQARGLLFLPARLIIWEIEHTRRWKRGKEETEGGECLSPWLKLWCPFALVFFCSICLHFSSHRRQGQERVSVYSSSRSRRQIREKHRRPISEAEFDRSLVPRAMRKNIKITTVSLSRQRESVSVKTWCAGIERQMLSKAAQQRRNEKRSWFRSACI